MANKQQIPSLSEKAFEALIRNGAITPNTEIEQEVLMYYKLKHEIPGFLHAIADGEQAEVEEYLRDNPQLVHLACGTATALSGDTFENVTAVQLAYLVDDEKIAKVLLDAVDALNNPAITEKVNQQLARKVSEVKQQEAQFKKYNFDNIVDVIKRDKNLSNDGKGITNFETEKAFIEFKEYFKPQVVTKGRPFNIQDLVGAYELFERKYHEWPPKKTLCLFYFVIRLLLGRVPASYGQAFSKGLNNPFDRSLKLEDHYFNEHRNLSYYSTCTASPSMVNTSISRCDKYFVDIINGGVHPPGAGCGTWINASYNNLFDKLNNWVMNKQQIWQDLLLRLEPKERALTRSIT